jgi:D-alanyl-D-alanine carboxypeptidase
MRRRLVAASVCCLALVVATAGTAVADGAPHRDDEHHHDHRHSHDDHHPHRFPETVRAKLRQAVAIARQNFLVPGVAFAVHEPGVGDFTATVGQADRVTGRPITSETHFRIGSVTKTFTATVILQLVQEHRVALDDKVRKWEPQLPFAGHITVRDLLDMHSGIFDEGGFGSTLSKLAGQQPTRAWQPQEIVDLAIKDGSQPPGQFDYSDTNYVILGIIAHAVTGRPIDNLIRHRIVEPLDLEDTSFPTTSMRIPKPFASPYAVGLPNLQTKGAVIDAATTYNPSVLGAAGAMISTLHDMQRWARALGTGKLLSPKLQTLRMQLLPTGELFGGLPGLASDKTFPAGYGLGIIGIHGFVGHDGVVNGMTTSVFFDPKTGATVVVLLNAEVFELVQGKSPTFVPVADALFVTAAEILAGEV